MTYRIFLSFLLVLLNTYCAISQISNSKQGYAKYLNKNSELLLDSVFDINAEKRKNFLLSLGTMASDSIFDFDIKGMAFREFPDISRFTNIKSINAEHNQLEEVVIRGKFINTIEYINLNNNKLQKIRVGRSKSIKRIDFDNNPIEKMPFAIVWSKGISNISFNNCNLKKLPWWLKYKKNISQLYVYNNYIKLTKSNVRRMRNITHLHISVCKNDSIPEYFSNLRELKKLVIYKSKINNLPSNFGKLVNLEVLILYENSFDEIPSVCFELPNLRHLDFYYNKVKFIPMDIIKCKNLEELYLSHNQIAVLPHSLSSMKKLKRLYIHHNNIEEVPLWVNDMNQLEVLDMGYNQITELPSFSKLINLHTVDFQSNMISEFPFQWFNLPSLNRVFLFDNPWKLTKNEYEEVLKKKEMIKENGGELFINF